MTAEFCSDPRHHAAFGYHRRDPEGSYCTACRVLPSAPAEPRSEAGEGTEVNVPLVTTPTPPVPFTDTPGLDASQGGKASPAPSTAPDRPHKQQRRCPYCGTPFTPRRNDKIWCSSNCRKNSYSRRRYARGRALAGLPYHPQARMAERTPFRLLLEEDADR
jgi:ribosomal protein L37AE/L43A